MGLNSTDSQGADKFNTVGDKIAHYITIKFTYSIELKGFIDKLQQTNITKPSAPEADAPKLDKDIYKEEVQEYVKEKKAIKRVNKQAYALVWGQCLQPTREKLKIVMDFDTIANKENAIDLLKAIKSTVFKFDNKCNIYVAMGNVIN
eukprot:4633654-Ditylum_brightwellii.AAC.1